MWVRFRPDNPLLPNYRHVPIAYHGRLVRGGQRHAGPAAVRSTRRMAVRPDGAIGLRARIGAIVGPGNGLGEPIPVGQARDHVAVVLVNDWSARDIQRWEYQPLGPFLAKNFATSISPFAVSPEALEPFRIDVTDRPKRYPISVPRGGSMTSHWKCP